jgi:hypothetical protein
MTTGGPGRRTPRLHPLQRAPPKTATRHLHHHVTGARGRGRLWGKPCCVGVGCTYGPPCEAGRVAFSKATWKPCPLWGVGRCARFVHDSFNNLRVVLRVHACARECALQHLAEGRLFLSWSRFVSCSAVECAFGRRSTGVASWYGDAQADLQRAACMAA